MAPRWLVRWVLNIIGIILTASIYTTGFRVTLLGAIFGSVILGLVNATIRPVILILTLPLNLLTLGLFTLVVNGFMLWLVSLVLGNNFTFQSFGAAVIAALILMIISSVISFFVKD
jgi:putative membrane protein